MKKRSILETIIVTVGLLIFLTASCMSCVKAIHQRISVVDPTMGLPRYIESVAMVLNEAPVWESGRIQGTAWAVDGDVLFSAGHVCMGAIEKQLGYDVEMLGKVDLITTSPTGKSDRTIKGTIIAIDPTNDMCLIRSENHGLVPLTLSSDYGLVMAGDPVIIVGSPVGYQYVFEFGTVISTDSEQFAGILHVNVMIDHGNSGSPVMWNGEVIGMAIAIPTGLRKTSLAVPVELLTKFYIENFDVEL